MIILGAFIFGALIGSFLNVVILRLPQGRSLGGRSVCPVCQHHLTAHDLVPMWSYLHLGGRCRHCGKVISSQYFVVELVTALSFALAAELYSPISSYWPGLLMALVVVTVGVAVVVTDFRHFLIFDKVVYTGIVLAVVINFYSDSLGFSTGRSLSGLLGALVCALPLLLLWLWSQGRWMGFGDVKYAVFMGLSLGYPLAIPGLLFAFWLGALVGLGLLVWGRKQLQSKLPFGVFLVIANLGVLVWGQPIWQWYVGILGF